MLHLSHRARLAASRRGMASHPAGGQLQGRQAAAAVLSVTFFYYATGLAVTRVRGLRRFFFGTAFRFIYGVLARSKASADAPSVMMMMMVALVVTHYSCRVCRLVNMTRRRRRPTLLLIMQTRDVAGTCCSSQRSSMTRHTRASTDTTGGFVTKKCVNQPLFIQFRW